MQYHQITSGERYAIAALRRQGLSLRAIASNLGRAPSSVCREVARNRCADGGYRAFKACHRTRGRRSRSRRNERVTPEAWAVVERYLRLDWSPEQVAGFLRCEGLLRISHETIYVHVWLRRLRIFWTRVCVASVSERKVRHGREEPTARESPRALGPTCSGAALEPRAQA